MEGPAEPPRPAFARTFPKDPDLDRLVDLFEQGNYAAVRKDAPALLAKTEDDAVRAAVRELQKRLQPDPLATGLITVAAILLAVLALFYWTHKHETPPRPAPAAPASS
ncbi:MAG: hypothetical protein R3B70_45350 [Polyangiaceae bacterium]